MMKFVRFLDYIELLKHPDPEGMCQRLGYSSSYHLGVVLDQRSGLLADLIAGLEMHDHEVVIEGNIVEFAKLHGVSMKDLATHWGLSREYVYRQRESALLLTAYEAVKGRVGDTLSQLRERTSSPELIASDLAVSRPLWTQFDLLAWWAPIDGSNHVQGLVKVLRDKRMHDGPLSLMLLDSIQGLPDSPPAIQSMEQIKKSRSLSLKKVNETIKAKGWKRCDLAVRWGIKDRQHLHKLLLSAASHPHIVDAILGLPCKCKV